MSRTQTSKSTKRVFCNEDSEHSPRRRVRINRDADEEAPCDDVVVRKVCLISRRALKLPKRQLKMHPKSSIEQLAAAIRTFGFCVPIVVDADNVVRAGVGRVEAAGLLGLSEIPCVRLEDLSDAKLRAFALAENRLAQNSRWDRQALAIELPELQDLLVQEDLDISSLTGFTAVEIDQVTIDFEENPAEPADQFEVKSDGIVVTRRDDVWELGPHRLWCGDACEGDKLKRLLGRDRAAMAFLDPPYNVKVKDVVGRGKIKHDEFAMASGEMSPAEFTAFLKRALSAAASVSQDGAVHFCCIDWRHLGELLAAADPVYGALLNLAVWVKSNAGQGSFYRSQHEHVGVFRVGRKPHLNNIELGRHGRSRSNVWNYAGVNTFRAGRLDDLRAHPTVKPIALVVDAIKDCTRRNDIVLDTFSGSGTTLLAAERTGRRFVGAEIEPRYVDLAIRRWQQFTGKDAVHVGSRRVFDEIAKSGRTST